MKQTSEEKIEQQFLGAYDHHADAIYRHCFFRVYNEEKAQDLVQETYTKTWNYLTKGNEIDNIRAFLYRVANNLIIDNSRKKTEESLEQILSVSPQLEPMGDDGSEMENRVMANDVLESMKNLPDETRELLIYRFVDDLEPREIAEILGITPNHVSVKLTRAVSALKQLNNVSNNNNLND